MNTAGKATVNHPCLDCKLPDCDDKSKGCALRIALNRYDSFKRKGVKAPDDVRQKNAIAYRELYAPAKNERRRMKQEATV